MPKIKQLDWSKLQPEQKPVKFLHCGISKKKRELVRRRNTKEVADKQYTDAAIIDMLRRIAQE